MRSTRFVALGAAFSLFLPAAWSAEPAARLPNPAGLHRHPARSHRAALRLQLERDLAGLRAAASGKLDGMAGDAPARPALESLLKAIDTRRPPAIRAALRAANEALP